MGLFNGIKNAFSKQAEGTDTSEVEVQKELDRTSVALVQADSGGSQSGQQINEITSYVDGSAVYTTLDDAAADGPSTLVSPEEGGTSEMIGLGGTELETSEAADEPDLDGIGDV
jgi:hypothetical protein